MKHIITLLCVLFFAAVAALSQDKFTLSIQKKDAESLQKGKTVQVGVFAASPVDSIGAFQIYIDFDRDVLQYVRTINLKPELQKEWMENESECCYAANWLTLDPEGLSLSKGDKLLDLEFTYNGGESPLKWQTEQIIEKGKLIHGNTLFFDVKVAPVEVELVDGCVCK